MENSPLGKLAAELRTRIWEFALIQEKPVFVASRSDGAIHGRVEFRIASEEVPSILQTCKQARNECTGIFYSANAFSFDVHPGHRRQPELEVGLIQWHLFRCIRKFCKTNSIQKVLLTSSADMTDPVYLDSASQEVKMSTLIRDIIRQKSAREGLEELKLRISMKLAPRDGDQLQFVIDACDYANSKSKAEKVLELALTRKDGLRIGGAVFFAAQIGLEVSYKFD